MSTNKHKSKKTAGGKKIVAFCCENSAYKAVETIRTEAMTEEIEFIKVFCAGAIETGRILECFENGAEKVVVLACPIDNCTYITGNCRALKRVGIAASALEDAGIGKERVRMEMISSVDTHKLIEILEEIQRT